MVGIGTDPAFVDALDRDGVEVIPTLTAAPLDDYEVGFLEDAEMLHHGRAIEFREQLGKSPGRFRAAFERIEKFPASFIRQRLEDQVVIQQI